MRPFRGPRRSGAQRRFLARFGRSGGGGYGNRRLAGPRRQQPRFAPLLQPITLTANVDGRRMMQQPVQYRRGDNWITKDRSPFPVALVGGEDDATPLIPCTHQLEED